MKSYLFVLVLNILCFRAESLNKLLFEGDDCKINTNEPGVCVRLSFCPHAQEMLKNFEHPIPCGFVKNIPIVCCGKMNTTYTYLAEKKCEIYSEPIFGIAVTMGQDAKLKEFPHMAALGYGNNEKKVWLCGGSLISENYVLTAGHCLSSLEYGRVKWVRLGVVDITQPEEDDKEQNIEVVKTVAHPLYKPPSVYNDIGLVEINKFISLGLYVKPACLYIKDTILEGRELVATGWGLTQVGGNQSNILQKVTLDLFTKEECDAQYTTSTSKRKLKDGILFETQLCAGGKTIGTDTCQGDSGGPIKMKIDEYSIYHIVGVTSFGKTCGVVNVPGVYTRVSYYVPWIESVIWPNEL